MRTNSQSPRLNLVTLAYQAAARQEQKTVLIYRNSLLPLSETFIKGQVMAYRRWRGLLIGKEDVHGLSLEGMNVRLLKPVRSYYLNKIWWRISQSLGKVPSRVIEDLKRELPSLLHVHFGLDAIEAWPLAAALDLPMVVTLHGYDINIDRQWWEAGHWGARLRHYPKRLLELSRQPRVHFIAVSNIVLRRAINFGIPKEKISVRHIGVNPRKFAPGGRLITKRERRVLFIGRLVEKKGCEYLIRAFAKVQNVIPDAFLVVVGDGDLRRQLQRLAQQLGVRAEFRGALAEAQVKQELETARVFCLPSVRAANGDAEGLPLVLLEAQASGVPVVTSARAASSEGVKRDITGLIFAERDMDVLASHLITLLTNDTMSISMSRAGPRFVADKFDLHRCTEALETLYDDVLARDPEGHPFSLPSLLSRTQRYHADNDSRDKQLRYR